MVDSNVIENFFRTHYKTLCLVSYQYVKNIYDAEDIVQDVFVNLINHKNLSQISNLEAYFKTSVRNSSLKKIQNIKTLVTIDEGDLDYKHFDVSEETAIIQEEEKIFLFKQLGRLPTQCRKVFLLCVLDNMKYKEVAALQDISVNTVKTQMKKAYKFLRKSSVQVYMFLNFKNKFNLF